MLGNSINLTRDIFPFSQQINFFLFFRSSNKSKIIDLVMMLPLIKLEGCNTNRLIALG